MPDDHSDVVPLLPIPNRTVKRVSADDSADPRVKVGHCQAITASESPVRKNWAFCFWMIERQLYVDQHISTDMSSFSQNKLVYEFIDPLLFSNVSKKTLVNKVKHF